MPGIQAIASAIITKVWESLTLETGGNEEFNSGAHKKWLGELCNHFSSSIIIFSKYLKIMTFIFYLQYFLENIRQVREVEVKNWDCALKFEYWT